MAAIKRFDANVYGADPTGVSDSSTAVQKVIDEAATARPGGWSGGEVEFDVGHYKLGSVRLKSGVTLKGKGCSGAGEQRGTWFTSRAANESLLTIDGGTSVIQSGAKLEDVTLDGNNLAGVTLLKVRMTNRVTLRDVSFQKATFGLLLDSAEDTVPGGDCSWHNFYSLHFDRCATGIFSRHSMGVQLYGADFNNAMGNRTAVNIRLGDTAKPALTTQTFRTVGVKMDEGAIHYDLQNAGFCSFLQSSLENGSTGFRVLKPTGSGSMAGRGNQFLVSTMGLITTGFDFAAGTENNEVIGVSCVSVTTPKKDAGKGLVWLPEFDRGKALFPAGFGTT